MGLPRRLVDNAALSQQKCGFWFRLVNALSFMRLLVSPRRLVVDAAFWVRLVALLIIALPFSSHCLDLACRTSFFFSGILHFAM